MSVLSLKSISKSYGITKVLENLSFTISKNEIVSIKGPSGSGKSTLLNIIGLIDSPSSGEVLIDSERINFSDESSLQKKRQTLGFIYQQFHLFQHLSVFENLRIPLLLRGDISTEKITPLLSHLNLSHRTHALAHTLSGGEAQRVAIGRALITSPRLLLADEPTGNLDEDNAAQILSLLSECRDKFESAIILVTHSERAAKIADRRLLLKSGTLVNE